MRTTARSLHGAADPSPDSPLEAADYIKAENLLLRQAQLESFPEEVKALISNRPLPTSSRLGSLKHGVRAPSTTGRQDSLELEGGYGERIS